MTKEERDAIGPRQKRPPYNYEPILLENLLQEADRLCLEEKAAQTLVNLSLLEEVRSSELRIAIKLAPLNSPPPRRRVEAFSPLSLRRHGGRLSLIQHHPSQFLNLKKRHPTNHAISKHLHDPRPMSLLLIVHGQPEIWIHQHVQLRPAGMPNAFTSRAQTIEPFSPPGPKVGPSRLL